MACTMASIPVAAVTCGGSPKVKPASRMILSANNVRLTTPALVVSPVVIIDTMVASEPVPAVVGICISGKRSPVTLSTPYISDNDCLPLINTANNLATSMELPPPKPMTLSHLNSRALATASITTASGGSATTSA